MTTVDSEGPRAEISPLISAGASVLIVAVGGGVGTAVRFAAVTVVSALEWPPFVWLLGVNLLGTVILGMAIPRLGGSMEALDLADGASEPIGPRPRSLRMLLAMAFCGGLTTYSGLAAELVSLWRAGSHALSATLLFVGLGMGMALVSLGMVLSRGRR